MVPGSSFLTRVVFVETGEDRESDPSRMGSVFRPVDREMDPRETTTETLLWVHLYVGLGGVGWTEEGEGSLEVLSQWVQVSDPRGPTKGSIVTVEVGGGADPPRGLSALVPSLRVDLLLWRLAS